MRRRGFLYLGAAAVLMTSGAGTALARVCQGNIEVQGSYGFVATRPIFLGIPAFPIAAPGAGTEGTAAPGTVDPNGAPAEFGNVHIADVGGLVAAARVAQPFSAVGTVMADGIGNLTVQAGPGLPATLVGTYQVNSDCTIEVRLGAGLEMQVAPPVENGNGLGQGVGVGTGPAAGNGDQAVAAPFLGVVVAGGNEINLVQTGFPGGTEMTLQRTLAPGGVCTDSTLVGSFGMVGNATSLADLTALPGTGTGNGTGVGNGEADPGVGVGTGGLIGPVGAGTGALVSFNLPLVGQLVADGMGSLGLSVVTGMNGEQQRLSGTYTVNPDCTGAATFVLQPGAMPSFQPGTETGTPGTQPGTPGTQPGTEPVAVPGTLVDDAGAVTRNIRFVLTREITGGIGLFDGSFRPVMHFVFTDPATVGGGVAKQN